MSPRYYIFSRYRDLLNQQDDFLVKTRIKLLLVCLLTFIALFVSLSILYAFQEHNLLLIRSLCFVVLFCVGLGLLLFYFKWVIAAHFFIICLILLIWSNVLLVIAGVNIVTVQYSILVLASAYYILNAKWGIIYSVIGILPLIGDVLIESYSDYNISIRHLVINNQAYVLTACCNFILLLFIHYSFFRALRKSNVQEKNLRISLQKALLEAEELGTAKTNFLTTMSHELRTPLNAVVGMTNILLMEGSSAGQKEHLDILRFSADNLMATVNDILDFNKINNEEIILDKKIFQPAELITKIIASFRPAAKEKRLKLAYQSDAGLKGLSVSGDPARLTQILFQLVGNAIKFTTKGFVLVEANIIALNTRTVRLHFNVIDSGIGIPQERQAQIFEPFNASLSRTSRQFHGTLGLTIAFHLVKLHNSTLHFKSNEGVGTQFEFDLTYPLAVVPVASKPAKTTATIDNMRVLIVEDEKLNILVMKKILAKWNITADVAMDGQQGVDMVLHNDYDVILMDINMPVMDGFEAAKQIRQLPMPEKAAVTIIAVTASIGAAIDQISRYPFIDDCLLKPFDPAHLKEKLIEIAERDVSNG